MAAYLVANVEITDADGYEDYRSEVLPTLTEHGGRYLARGGATEVLEGDMSAHRMVILEFPSMEQLKAWYDSPAYRTLRAIRHRTARSNLVAIEGL